MKVKFTLLLAFMLFSFISCQAKNIASSNEMWKIHFDTAKGAGLCYFAYKDPIITQSTNLTFQNRNDFSVHVILYNKTNQKGKAEYEDDIDAGGLITYENVKPGNEYSVGIRVADGKGVDDVCVIVYGKEKVLPYVLED